MIATAAESPHRCDSTLRAWHDAYVPVLLWVAIAVILIAVFYTATGRGGELAYEHADHAPLNLGAVSGADVALLRPPTALWGYNMQVTDTALDTIAQALRDRDVAIAHLQQQLTDLNYHLHGTTPAPPVGQDFRTRIDEGPPGFQPRPFPGRHEAHGLTPPEAWLAPAEAPAAEPLPDPLVWEAPDPEPPQDQPSPAAEDQVSWAPQDQAWSSPQDQPSPAAQDQTWLAPPDRASSVAQDQAWSAPQDEAWSSPPDQASPDPADQADPRAVGFAPAPGASASAAAPGASASAPAPGAPASAPNPAAASAVGPGTAAPGPGTAASAPGPGSALGSSVGPSTSDTAPGSGPATPSPGPSGAAPGRHAADDAIEQGR
jgi:hypothetical protein